MFECPRKASTGNAQRVGTITYALGWTQHRTRADDLNAGRVLGPSEGVRDRADTLGVAGRCHELAHLEVLRLRCAADTLDGFRGIAIDVLLEELEDRARML